MESIYGMEGLDEFIINNINQVIVLYFGASWCAPCKKLKEKLVDPETREIMPRLAVGYINIDDEANNKITELYNINMLPTQIFVKVKDNRVKEVNRIDGYDFIRFTMCYNDY